MNKMNNEKRQFASEWLLLLSALGLLAYLGVLGGSEFLTWAARPRAGSLAKLSGDRDLLRIASDKKTSEQATEAEATRDEPRLNELMRSEKLFLVPNGTKVQVLDAGWTDVEIKILDGTKMGRVGHVPTAWVKAESAEQAGH